MDGHELGLGIDKVVRSQDSEGKQLCSYPFTVYGSQLTVGKNVTVHRSYH